MFDNDEQRTGEYMSSKVSLTVVKGSLSGKTYQYEGRTSVLIGRGVDCNPRLPDNEFHRTISRNHCLLDINPPAVRVRDFGSLNGTFVNGRKIGQRKTGSSAGETSQSEFPEHDLQNGDELKLGGTIFRVNISKQATCAECGAGIPEKNEAQALADAGLYFCEKHEPAGSGKSRDGMPDTQILKKTGKKCSRCGKDTSSDTGKMLQGEFICGACRSDPLKIAQSLVASAKNGSQNLMVIKGYTIIRELGKGGMGAVYLARREDSEDLVALKVMLAQVAVEKSARSMFLREVATTRALKHPNIVELKDSGYSEGTFFFTLEYCEGGSVDQLMEKRGGKIGPDEALPIVMQALDGLDYAHNAQIEVKLVDGSTARTRGVVHRDIKPANIFLSGSGVGAVAKIADVGLGKAFDLAGLSGQTRTGAVVGTPYFISRQQVINFKYAKPDIDVWSMAASLYNMLTGRFPRKFVKGKDPWQIVLQTDAEPILNRDKSLPPKLAQVIDHALIDKPEIRFKTAREFKQALADAM